MRWLNIRGAAVHDFAIWTVDTFPSNFKHFIWRHHRDGSMLLLAQLPNLHHLDVGGHEFMIPERHLHAIELLPDLQRLFLSMPSDGTWSKSTLEALAHMRALTSLKLNICKMSGPLLVPTSLAQLTQLQELRLDCGDGGSNEDSEAHLMQTISNLTGLRTLVLNDMVMGMPAGLERLACLTFLELESRSGGPKLYYPSFLWSLHQAQAHPLYLCSSVRSSLVAYMQIATAVASIGLSRM